MLNRQKLIVDLLRAAARPVSKLELMKWAFVIAKECKTGGGDAFYEFLPFHYGPYSFGLQRDLDTLASFGAVIEHGMDWTWNPATGLTSLPAPLAANARNIADRFRDWSANDVINYVYRTYPAYTVNSKRERLAPRPVACVAVYTSGYEGLQIDGFLDRLIQAGIYRLIDVRHNPVARRYGFHKSTLKRLCELLQIDYVHIPELGIVSSERQQLDTSDDYNRLFERYESQTIGQQPTTLSRVAQLMQERPSVLVCMEADACRCHRSRLAAAVSRLTGLAVAHLGA
jgi:uncharacterized protein (DUF488 family)